MIENKRSANTWWFVQEAFEEGESGFSSLRPNHHVDPPTGAARFERQTLAQMQADFGDSADGSSSCLLDS